MCILGWTWNFVISWTGNWAAYISIVSGEYNGLLSALHIQTSLVKCYIAGKLEKIF